MHVEQVFASGGLSEPQKLQVMPSKIDLVFPGRIAPHILQRTASGRFSIEHEGHFKTIPPPEYGVRVDN